MDATTLTRSPYHARRPGVLGVHSLDHFSLSVPDAPVAKTYYDHFGLDVRENAGTLELRAGGSDHVWGVLREGRAKALAYTSFGAYADDLPRLRAHIEALGIKLLDAPPGITSEGIWFRDPHGALVEVHAAQKVMPDSKAVRTLDQSPAGVRGAAFRADVARVTPGRLGHVLFFTPDVAKSIEFYSAVLGLRLSDHPGPVAFMHAPHGSDHHVIAFALCPDGIGYHHSAWDVPSIDHIGIGAMNMAENGYARGWGLGRHVLGSNYFHYVRDPWGSYAEYSCDIDYVPVDMDWEAGHPAPENSLYLWGPDVPADFIVNYEAIKS